MQQLSASSNNLLVQEDETKVVEKQKQLKNLSNYLKQQIAKKLHILNEEKHSEWK